MSGASPQEQIARMVTGYWASQAVYVAAKLGIADLLAGGPRSAEDLAREVGAHERSLDRLLRALASLGVFAEGEGRRFALTPLADCLRDGVPGSQRALVLMMGEWSYHAWGDLLGSVRTGRSAFEQLYGKPLFDHLAEHPEEARIFDAAMTSIHGRETGAMLDAYDFSGVGTLADIGGGNGSTLLGVLRRHPSLRGLLFDLPHVVERAGAEIEAAGMADRCQVVAGSFFESIPGGADAYLLRHIIHDWDDAESMAILRNVRRALGKARGRLLVVETVIPPGNEPSFGKLLDLNTLVNPGGLERTEEEYRRLYESAGFRLTRIVPTAADVSVIEGEPA
jgi:hypothetical protein